MAHTTRSTAALLSGGGASPRPGRKHSKLRVLVGSGDKIALFTLPFLVAGLALNTWAPSFFSVGGPPPALSVLSVILLIPGIGTWLWSVVLILTRVPRGELITSGPYSVIKHPLYTSVALLVLPWVGFLLDTWLGALLGVVLYAGSRMFSPEEERTLAKTFGRAWDGYRAHVKIPWL